MFEKIVCAIVVYKATEVGITQLSVNLRQIISSVHNHGSTTKRSKTSLTSGAVFLMTTN